MIPGFIVSAAVAGLLLAVMAGPLGSLIVWRRMAYFGEAMAHATMLGIGLSLVLSINPAIGVVLVCLLLALMLAKLQPRGLLASDTLLGVVSHGALALGLLLVSLSSQPQINLDAFLFGDLLTVSHQDLAYIAIMAALVLVVLSLCWQALVSITVQEELAQIEGINVAFFNTLFLCLVAITIALGIKLLGVILITAMMIMPAASARRMARSPEQMALIAVVFGCLGVLLGLALSFMIDTPTGPSIISANLLLFALSLLLPQR
jgi:zinc transport system permease protein